VVVPVGVERAGSDVEVTVLPVPSADADTNASATAEAWREFIARTAGSIDDPTFQRHSEGEYERRADL
jgi:hypothetical protein